MAELRDKPRPDVYWPNTPSQWREPSVDDCTWYAGEFAFQAASDNHLSMHPVRDLRNKSSDTSGGTPVDVMLREMWRLWPKSEGVGYYYGGFTRQDIRRALRDGATIVYGGDYEKLPSHYRRWTSNDNFNHAMASRDMWIDKNGVARTFLYDPLGGGPQRAYYDGEWIKLTDVLEFNWNASNTREWVGIVYNRREPGMKYLNLPAEYRPDRVARVKYGAEVKADPHVGSNRVRRFWNKEAERPVLYATDNGWRCILWKSNGEWSWGYVDPEDVIVTKGVEVPPIDDGGDDVPPEELEEAHARINELEGALQVNLEVSEAALAGSDETVPLEDA